MPWMAHGAIHGIYLRRVLGLHLNERGRPNANWAERWSVGGRISK